MKRAIRIKRNGKPFITLGYNAKIDCYHFSVSPEHACAGRPCYAACYAAQCNPITRASQQVSWERNTEACYLPHAASHAIASKIQDHKFFRWNVAGDVTQAQLTVILMVVQRTPNTRHLLFTKDRMFYRFLSGKYPNLSVILSLWPGMMEEIKNQRFACVIPRDAEQPEGWLECLGECASCRACWYGKMNIAFRAHGPKAKVAEQQVRDDAEYMETIRSIGRSRNSL